jgi:hypothetical protein
MIKLSYRCKFKVILSIYVGRALMEEVLRKEAIRRHLFGESPIEVYTEEQQLRTPPPLPPVSRSTARWVVSRVFEP